MVTISNEKAHKSKINRKLPDGPRMVRLKKLKCEKRAKLDY